MAAHPFRKVDPEWLSEGMSQDHGPVLTVSLDEYACTSLAFSHDATLLAVGKSNGMVGLWDLAAREPVRHFLHDLCGAPVPAVAFSADDLLLATGGRDGHLKIRDLRTGKVILRRQHPGEIQAIAFDPAATMIATACTDGVVRVWSRRGRITGQVADGCTPATRSLTWAADGTVTAADGPADPTATSADGRLMASATGTELAVWESSSA